jgi:hypothetical protein
VATVVCRVNLRLAFVAWFNSVHPPPQTRF